MTPDAQQAAWDRLAEAWARLELRAMQRDAASHEEAAAVDAPPRRPSEDRDAHTSHQARA